MLRLLDDFRLVESGLHNSEDDPELALREYSWDEIVAAAAIDRDLWAWLVTRAATGGSAAPVPAPVPTHEPVPARRTVSRAAIIPAGPVIPVARPARKRRGGVPV